MQHLNDYSIIAEDNSLLIYAQSIQKSVEAIKSDPKQFIEEVVKENLDKIIELCQTCYQNKKICKIALKPLRSLENEIESLPASDEIKCKIVAARTLLLEKKSEAFEVFVTEGIDSYSVVLDNRLKEVLVPSKGNNYEKEKDDVRQLFIAQWEQAPMSFFLDVNRCEPYIINGEEFFISRAVKERKGENVEVIKEDYRRTVYGKLIEVFGEDNAKKIASLTHQGIFVTLFGKTVQALLPCGANLKNLNTGYSINREGDNVIISVKNLYVLQDMRTESLTHFNAGMKIIVIPVKDLEDADCEKPELLFPKIAINEGFSPLICLEEPLDINNESIVRTSKNAQQLFRIFQIEHPSTTLEVPSTNLEKINDELRKDVHLWNNIIAVKKNFVETFELFGECILKSVIKTNEDLVNLQEARGQGLNFENNGSYQATLEILKLLLVQLNASQISLADLLDGHSDLDEDGLLSIKEHIGSPLEFTKETIENLIYAIEYEDFVEM